MKKNYLIINSVFLLTVFYTDAQQTVGLFLNDPGSLDGYVLFSPIPSNNTYLIDQCGKLVHSWTSTHHPGQSVYLLPDGNLVRPGSTGNPVFTSGGNGGIMEKFDWNSNLLWSYTISSTSECQHHDICPLPNGNVLAIVWESKSSAQAIAAGRNPSLIGNSFWSEKIIELQPVGTNSANVVWEWHAWDHLVQDYDATKLNYDTISHHPELINLNYNSGAGTNADWLHCNSIAYNDALDQIIISSHNFNEIWIVDHSTTTAEAASNTGGSQAKGGDLLYRWGNPAAYYRGNATDRKLFGQHHAHWIENGMTDGGKIMIFNNGMGRPAGNFSSVDVINPPVDLAGSYSIAGNQSYQPDTLWWTYQAAVPTDFYSTNISGAQRLSNGNTIICEGPQGTFFEIDSAKNTVWRYVSPVAQSGILTQSAPAVQNLVFRCTLYEPSYPGFAGQNLVAGNPIEINPLSYTCPTITGVEELANGISWTFQNPCSGNLVLRSDEEISNATIYLYDLTGHLVDSWMNVNLQKKNQVELKLSNSLSNGFYLFNIKSSLNSSTLKIIYSK